MPRTVTVGLDGSPESHCAADWAAREAEARGLPLRLVHAWEVQHYTYAPMAGIYAVPAGEDPQRHWAERVLRETQARLKEGHPGLRITGDSVPDHPVLALTEAAREAEMLVLGSRGLGSVAGFLVGSVAAAVVARAERPVVLVRAGVSAEDEHLPDADGSPCLTTEYRDIVLGLDVREPADGVLEFAFETAARRGAPLRIVHGWSLPPYYAYGVAVDAGLTAELNTEEQRRLSEVLAPWREKFPTVEVTEQAVIGGAGSHLVDASREAGLVIVGRKARRAAVGAHIGPVTHALLHHSAAPVAVVPHH
ncbi:universal stress protein [Streptomyces sp. GC420]|uniref:universal stress protein n=1 Tax=Streptomyces sp. GC420 TaxID=2697568 RepID=UPI00141509CD|nr:universal stress protein [Streptomyces sp. GC420]NBM18840.1 universal stress protein [Streptomyces sp. GC420]